MLKHFIGLALILKAVICLNKNNMCLRSQLKRETNFLTNNCTGQYMYRCDFETCAINMSECGEFLLLKSGLRLEVLPFAPQVTFYRFHMFIKSLQACPEMWKPRDACSLGKVCFVLRVLKKNDSFKIKKTKCPCRKEHSQRCDKTNYCAKD